MRILITGADGLVGRALAEDECCSEDDLKVFVSRKHFDLTDRNSVEEMFSSIKPHCVIHAAARVGGIGRNLNSPVQQFSDNILMNTNVIDMAHKYGVEKLIAFSSVCAFPASAQVLTEDILHDGAPFPAHGAYAYSKRMVDVQIEAYRKQYGRNYCSIIPGNIFGANDNFNIIDGHVVPSLIHKAFVAKRDKTELQVWGDGSPLREFISAKDLAEVCIKLLEFDNLPQRLIASGQEISIKELVGYVTEAAKIDKISWDTSKPNGQLRRPTKSQFFDQYFPDFKNKPIKEEILKTYQWFEENYEVARK